jgi:hypothetical protein
VLLIIILKDFIMTTTINRSSVVMQKTATFTAVSALLAGTVMAMSAANAATEVTILPSAGGSTTVVEQYSDGKTAVITATPNSIGMQDGMPFAVTQVTNVPRYMVRQGTINTVVTQGSATVTSVPVTNQITNQSSRVDVIAVPANTVTQVLPTTQILPVTTATQLPVINTSVINAPVITTPVTTITSIDALQLKPTFSTPDVVNAQTKVMKILKNSDGREVAVPANHIAPGDVIEYHTVYTNTTAQPVTDINAMVSLPSGIRMVSLNSPLPTLATTGGDSYQTIHQVGNTVIVKENYSGLKWNLVNLNPNAAQTVVIRAKVQ